MKRLLFLSNDCFFLKYITEMIERMGYKINERNTMTKNASLALSVTITIHCSIDHCNIHTHIKRTKNHTGTLQGFKLYTHFKIYLHPNFV